MNRKPWINAKNAVQGSKIERNIGVGQEWQDTIPEMVSQHPCYWQMKPRHPGLTSSLTYGEAQACFNKWMWYTMKLLGKWYKCQAERTKNKLRGE